MRGTSQLTCKAIQETLSASSLNTNDCFVLVNPDQVDYNTPGLDHDDDNDEDDTSYVHGGSRDGGGDYDFDAKIHLGSVYCLHLTNIDHWILYDDNVSKHCKDGFQVTVWFGKGSTGDEREMAKVTKLLQN